MELENPVEEPEELEDVEELSADEKKEVTPRRMVKAEKKEEKKEEPEEVEELDDVEELGDEEETPLQRDRKKDSEDNDKVETMSVGSRKSNASKTSKKSVHSIRSTASQKARPSSVVQQEDLSEEDSPQEDPDDVVNEKEQHDDHPQKGESAGIVQQPPPQIPYVNLQEKSAPYEGTEGETFQSEADRESVRSEYLKTPRQPIQKLQTPRVVEEERKDKRWFLEGMPSSFRLSSLVELVYSGEGKLSTMLRPKMNASGVQFADLLYDDRRAGLRQNFDAVSFRITVGNATDIPVAGVVVGTQVLSRRLRVCVFDPKQKPSTLSNVHTLTSIWSIENPKLWKFPSKRGVFVARAKENNFLVRFPRKSPEFNLLFELCVLLSKKDRQGREETGELSCGWAIFHPWKARTDPNMPLNLDVGVHQLTINEGSPFEKGIQMPTTPRTQAATKPSFLQKLIMKNKGPTLSLKLSNLDNHSEIQALSYLPDCIITSPSSAPLIALYRQIQVDHLLIPYYKTQQTLAAPPIADPVLSGFPHICDTADVLEALKAVWIYKSKAFKREQTKDANFMKHHFGRTIIHVLPLLSIASLPHEVVSNEETQKARYDIIQKFISDRPELNVVQNVHHLAYMPFDIKEIMS